MISRLCWACQVHAELVREGNASRIHNIDGLGSDFDVYSVAMKCQWCGTINIAIVHVHARMLLSDVHQRVDNGSNIVRWHPAPSRAPDLSAAPKDIAGPAREVYLAKDAGAKRASIIMGRAVIESIAKDNGVTEKIVLAEKIDRLKQNGVILAATAEDAHEVRHLGNDMAHGDFDIEVTDDDVDDVIGIMYDLVEQLYLSTARRKRMRERRESRKAKD